MNTEKVMEVLRRVEWVRRHGRPGFCPLCGGWEYAWGHYDDCKLDALLSEGEKEKAVSREELEAGYVKALEALADAVTDERVLMWELPGDIIQELHGLGLPEAAMLRVLIVLDNCQTWWMRRGAELGTCGGRRKPPLSKK